MSRGYVYILSNPSMQGMVKVGRTTRCVQQRAGELWQTGVPTPFVVEHEVFSPDCEGLESEMHAQLSAYRVNGSREFFYTPENGISAVTDRLDERLRAQVQDMIQDYLPDCEIVSPDLGVGEASVLWIATQAGRCPTDVAAALSLVTTEELAPAMRRLDKAIQARKEARANGEEMPQIRAVK